MGKICKSCGYQCQDSNIYCPSCGTKFGESVGQTEPQVSSQWQPDVPPQQSGAYQTPQTNGYQYQQPNGYQYQQTGSGYQCQQPVRPAQGYRSPSYGTSSVYRHGPHSMDIGGNMKWFKFIIYFQLIYTGISCCFQFFAYLGLEQLVDTLQQYNLGSLISGFALFESTVFTALISGALAVLAFYTRSRLARRRHGIQIREAVPALWQRCSGADTGAI